LERLTANKPFDFRVDPNHDPDAGILNGSFTTMAAVCGLLGVVGRASCPRSQQCCS